ncbi:MAG: hypothetical protein ABIE36_03070 [Candidatus Diapherotrites archaeon]
MLSQIKFKKGVSVIIGYVILVSFVIVLGIIVYSWMKTYVPTEEINCPDGLSMFIKNYECSSGELNLYLKNNGKFNIGGYFIYATDSPEQELATIDISRNITEETAKLYPTGIRLGKSTDTGNSLAPNEEETEKFDISGIEAIYSVEILPIRWQEENNKRRLVSCKDAKIKETIFCLGTCTADAIEETCAERECGTIINNCMQEINCGDCTGEELCDSDGQCVPPAACTDTCDGLECGTICGTNCGANNGLCDLTNANSACSNNLCVLSSCIPPYENCNNINSDGCEIQLGTLENCGSCGDACTSGEELCVDGECNSCNGDWISPENSGVECDGGSLCLADCTCTEGYESDGIGGCGIPDTIVTCPGYCIWLGDYGGGTNYINGFCRQNEAQCTKYDEVWELTGDVYCAVAVTSFCCCQP